MIFVDTSFWVASVASRDAHHAEAMLLMRAHGDDQLITSSLVRGETWTFMRRRYGHRVAVAFLDRLERSQRVRVEPVTEDMEAQALRWLKHHDEREYSFVDATSFAMMRAMRMRQALAFDGDFAAVGYVELRA